MIEEIDLASDRPALRVGDGTAVVNRRTLGEQVAAARRLLAALPRPTVVFSFAPNSTGAVAAYLACLEERVPLGLGEPRPKMRDRLAAAYVPAGLWLADGEAGPAGYERRGGIAGGGVAFWVRAGGGAYPVAPHAELALLLGTSGSTGDAKMVRLTAANLRENARAIASYLSLGPGETAAQSLPMHYSYGLSVLNSHLLAGAAVQLSGHSFMRPEFWSEARAAGCTSFAGVPYMYETLQRLRMNPCDVPTLRTLTQAGGHLRVEVARHFHELTQRVAGRFFVMYGQTEATARIAYVPPERLADKLGGIGVAIPGGRLWLEPVDGDAAVQQLHYAGPNVMMGYAQGPEDLARGDEMGGRLATGDLAEVDVDGFFRLTGRLARFAKLFGKRVNLASVEHELESRFGVRVAVVEGAECLRVFLETSAEALPGEARAHLARGLGVPPPAVQCMRLQAIPLTASGKKDYKALA